MDSTGFQRTLKSAVCNSTLVANWNSKIPEALDWTELDWSLCISLLLFLDFLWRPGRWNDKRDTQTPKAERPEMIKPRVTIWVAKKIIFLPYFTSWMPPGSLCRTTNFFLGKDVYLDRLKCCYEEFHGPNQSDLGVELNGQHPLRRWKPSLLIQFESVNPLQVERALCSVNSTISQLDKKCGRLADPVPGDYQALDGKEQA